jgi:D-amino-acid oxidase
MQAIVLGCGVSGLSSGIRLREAGFEVTIWAKDVPPNTTSNIAAAVWHPFRAYPIERVLAWGQRTLEVLYELTDVPESAVYPQECLEIYSEEVGEPWWRPCVRQFRFAREEDMPPGFGGGYVFETMTVETGTYLEYLVRRFEDGGGKIIRREVGTLDEALAECPLVVNCTGLGSSTLLGDTELVPVRGQVVRVEKVAVPHIMLDEREDDSGMVGYIVPRRNDCILGGTTLAGEWSLEPDPETAQRIIERCAQMAPEVRDARVLELRVGLRPGRSAVRLEAEEHSRGTVIHNYGHGGAGITLSWGCAEEVTALALAVSA